MKYIKMSKTGLIREHKKLVKILRYGNRRTILKEASKQNKELKKYLKHK
jgi:hypothetical protein